MGACTSASSDVICARKKYSRPGQSQMKNITSRPTSQDLSSTDMENYSDAENNKIKDFIGAQVGVYFMKEELINKLKKSQSDTQTKETRIQKWGQMIQYGLLSKSEVFPHGRQNLKEPEDFTSVAFVGLQNFYNNHPQKFISRLAKGPPPSYRWLAWRFMSRQILKSEKGLYNQLLREGKTNKWLHDIEKDLGRTYPSHPLFDVKRFGQVGQKVLRHILQAYAVYNPEIGYCQSLNFVVGFILLTSNCKEIESFWVFAALLTQKMDDQHAPKMVGLHGLYLDGFPSLLKLQAVFDNLFEEQLPNLRNHFMDENISEMLWITKWFQSCFLYCFPMGLCLRIWDNIFAFGTRFLISAALAILKLIESELIKLDIDGINDYFKLLKNEDEQRFKLLPDFEVIIDESKRINKIITDDRIDQILNNLGLSQFQPQKHRQEFVTDSAKKSQNEFDEEAEKTIQKQVQPHLITIQSSLVDEHFQEEAKNEPQPFRVIKIRKQKKKKIARRSVNQQPKQASQKAQVEMNDDSLSQLQVEFPEAQPLPTYSSQYPSYNMVSSRMSRVQSENFVPEKSRQQSERLVPEKQSTL